MSMYVCVSCTSAKNTNTQHTQNISIFFFLSHSLSVGWFKLKVFACFLLQMK